MAKTKTTDSKQAAKGGKAAKDANAKHDGGSKHGGGSKKQPPAESTRLVRSAFPRLDEVDLDLDLSREQESDRLADAQARLLYLRLVLGGLNEGDGTVLGPPVTVVFEGWDASGKGGAIRRLLAPMDPRHVRVAQFAAPTYDEKRHHFLARFWPALPGWGGMTVMDRSWYGRVMVERVEGYATDEQWRRAYNEIFEFERTLCAEGMILIKFWMHISHDEQARRFERRAKDPLKRWKLTDEDWRNRDKRPAYEAAVEEMLDRTSHPAAPWSVVPADSKRYARVYVLETVIAEIERGMRERGFKVPSTPKGLRANRW